MESGVVSGGCSRLCGFLQQTCATRSLLALLVTLQINRRYFYTLSGAGVHPPWRYMRDLGASTLPKTNGEVSVRAGANPCHIVSALAAHCRQRFLLGKVLGLPEVSRGARHYAK